MPNSEDRDARFPRSVYIRRRPPLASLAPPEETKSPPQLMSNLARHLRTVQMDVSRILQQCQELLESVSDDRSHRDALHLRARVQGIEQCTRDAEQTLARLRSRIPIGETAGTLTVRD